MSTRAELINQLALSMGTGRQTNSADSASKSRYNSKTGTLYCNNKKDSSQDVAVQSLAYFAGLRDKYSKSDTQQGKQLTQMYQYAVECMKMMQSPKVKEAIRAEKLKKAAF